MRPQLKDWHQRFPKRTANTREEGADPEVGISVKDLGLPPEAGAAHEGALGQVGQAGGCGRDEGIPHILPGQVARQDRPLWQVCGHILQRKHKFSALHPQVIS